jgi:hypothetical protein
MNELLIVMGIHVVIGFLCTTLVEQKPTTPLGLFIGFWVVVFLWPYILLRSTFPNSRKPE